MLGVKKAVANNEKEGRWAEFEAEALPYIDELFRIAMWLVRDRTEAEDIVQETFTQALQSFHRYEAGTNVRAWLVTILYRVKGKRQRAARRLQLVDDAEERIAETIAFEPPITQNLVDEEVLAVLESLPAQFREVIVLSDVQEFSYKEIAEAMGIPIGTVMSRLSRGRKLLRAELAVYANAYGIGARARTAGNAG